MAGMKTPGVYIVEKNALPNSVVEVATAVPAFVGYTEKALDGSHSLLNKPRRIASMAEFNTCFGGAPLSVFGIAEDAGAAEGIRFQGKNYVLQRRDHFALYSHLRLFYANGGGPCYVVSVGDYGAAPEKTALESGLATLLGEQEPSLVVIPEAVCLSSAEDCYALQRAMLRHCGKDTQSRFAILDIYDGFKPRKDPAGDCVDDFRQGIGAECLDYGAAYYPWLDTSLLSEDELDFTSLDPEPLRAILTAEVAESTFSEEQKTQIQAFVERLGAEMDPAEAVVLHRMLSSVSPFYKDCMREARRSLNRLPVSAAMAGVYTTADNTRGVWKAPANMGISMAAGPMVDIGHAEQEELNVPLSGKAVNAIRTFVGEGIKVWGARTLDGNSLDWRYINVRRTGIMLEGSVKNAVSAYAFEPNVANTWWNLKAMLSDFLRGIWKRGGLAGATPEDAYEVHVGLGETMTPEDILDGKLRVRVLAALVRPGEFIEISMELQMQKA